MLCPNTQAVTNEYLAGWASRPFFSQNVSTFGFGDGSNVYEMRVSNPIFPPRSPQYRYVGGKNRKKVCENRETTLVHAHFFP